MFTQPHTVRLLSINKAVSVVCRSLKSLRDVLEHMTSSDAQDAAKGLLMAVRQFNFVTLRHTLKDILMDVVLLSKRISGILYSPANGWKHQRGPGRNNSPPWPRRRGILQGPHVQKVRTHFFTSMIRCIKSKMTVEMCGASRKFQGCRTHFSTAVDSLATLRGDVGKLL